MQLLLVTHRVTQRVQKMKITILCDLCDLCGLIFLAITRSSGGASNRFLLSLRLNSRLVYAVFQIKQYQYSEVALYCFMHVVTVFLSIAGMRLILRDYGVFNLCALAPSRLCVVFRFNAKARGTRRVLSISVFTSFALLYTQLTITEITGFSDSALRTI